jgi:hypothetical protein
LRKERSTACYVTGASGNIKGDWRFWISEYHSFVPLMIICDLKLLGTPRVGDDDHVYIYNFFPMTVGCPKLSPTLSLGLIAGLDCSLFCIVFELRSL